MLPGFRYTPRVQVIFICFAGRCAIEIFFALCQLKNCRSYTVYRTLGKSIGVFSRYFNRKLASVIEVPDFYVLDQIELVAN